MGILRPEIKETIWRFRDALIGMAISVVGIFWAVNSLGFMAILGMSMAIAGAMLVFAGIQRGRFRSGAGGAGVVTVVEGQVTYFGPHEGGSIVIADLTRVELDPTGPGEPCWILFDPNLGQLRIPTDAEGSEQLFDVFAGLNGIQTERMLSRLRNSPKEQVVIWQSNAPALH